MRMARRPFHSWLPLVIYLLQTRPTPTTAAKFQATVKTTSDAALFAPCPELHVLGPSVFPAPTDAIAGDIQPIVRPIRGRHRPRVDAVFAYAEGYQLGDYMMFVETLTATGFTGDVVLAIAEDRIVHKGVKEYLSSKTLNEKDEDDHKLHIVLYQHTLQCADKDGTVHAGRTLLKRSGETDSFQMCQLDHVYGHAKNGTTVPDPREGRVVATLRYEWYWIWSVHYEPNAWILLMDARDTYFQTNPFTDLPRSPTDATSGVLYFFGENAAATRLGKSRKNMQWLRKGYGEDVLNILSDKPTICSGGTMGEQVALETYLRAMVNEHDECDIKMTGSDQGFHNYLYYSSKLHQADAITQIVVWEQGFGRVNNVGAMRTQPFADWGMYDENSESGTDVYQWDGTSLSPVVHQWDRDKNLHTTMKRKQKEWQQKWEAQQAVSAKE